MYFIICKCSSYDQMITLSLKRGRYYFCSLNLTYKGAQVTFHIFAVNLDKIYLQLLYNRLKINCASSGCPDEICMYLE